MDPLQHRASTPAAYERLAPVWDDTDDNLWNEGLERANVRRLVPRPLDGLRVLDAGCASGAHASWFSHEGCQVVGLDVSPGMVAQAHQRFGGRAQFLVADLVELPLAADSFDGILSSLVLHYLEDFTPTLRQFARVLRPNGWLLVTLDHPAGTGPHDDEHRDYFETRMITDIWKKNEVVVTQSFWRRPLSAVIDAFADAGFMIERIGEPQLDDEMRRRFPEDAAMIEGRPTFITYLARPVQTR